MAHTFRYTGLAFGAVLAAVTCLPNTTFAGAICRAIALRDVGAVGASSSVIPRGGYDEAVTQYNIDKATGEASFCSHGGFCYPTHVYINGQKQEALRLVNCKVGAREWEDARQVSYAVDVDRARNSAATLREDDVNNRFRSMGFCSACADNVAAFYVRRPNSACGRLAKQALEGNPNALARLQQGSECDRFPWEEQAAQAGARR